MKVSDLVKELNLTVFCGEAGLDAEISGGYTSDLLSDVMGHIDEGMLWVTMQTHQNIVAVATLKDAAAVAPYGMAGANGVVLVTTKKGKSGAPVLSYNGYIGFQNPTRITDQVNSYEYALMKNEAAMNAGYPNYYAYSQHDLEMYRKTCAGDPDADPDRYPNSNGLRDLVQNNSVITNHNLQLSGGSDKFQYLSLIHI